MTGHTLNSKPKFVIDEHKGECVMHCDAKEKAKIFCNYLDLKGKTWCSKTSYKAFNPWYLFEENTCYDFNTGEFGDKNFYEKKGYTILEFDDFDWNEEDAMNCEKLLETFKNTVAEYTNEYSNTTDNLKSDDVYVVWSRRALQNYKALLSTPRPNKMYYELTYNGDKNEFYFDAYKKFENKCFTNVEVK